MPITQLLCPKHPGPQSVSHFAETDCGLTVCPPDYIAAVLADRDVHHERGLGRVSLATGCPRSAVIMLTEEVAVDPLAFNAALTGTAWHELLGRQDAGTAEVEVTGVIEALFLVGHIDRVTKRDGHIVLHDQKHGNDFSRKYAELKPEYVVQLSLYAELYRQTFDEQPAGGVIWRHFTGSPPFIAFPFTLWPLERCLDHAPYNGSYRVRDILRQAAEAINGASWRELPLVGASMNFGSKSFCDYCEVAHVCKEAASGAPW